MKKTNNFDHFLGSPVYDVNRFNHHGQFVLPISQSKITTSQKPKKIMEYLDSIGRNKVADVKIDVYIVYTNGLYQNSSDNTMESRLKNIAQVSNHAQELKKLISKTHGHIPGAYHFISWDYFIINSPLYSKFFSTLHKLLKTNREFQKTISTDLFNINKKINLSNTNFILEELTVNHLLRQKFIKLPTLLSKEDTSWRLIIYPGNPLLSDVFLNQENLLPENNKPEAENTFANSLYNCELEKMFDFKRLASVKEKMNDNFESIDSVSKAKTADDIVVNS